MVLALVSVAALMLLSTSCFGDTESPDGEGPLEQGEGVEVGNSAPDFQLQSLDGESVSLSSLRGETVLLNFWATWCPPCRGEMPYIQGIYEDWVDRGLVILAVNIGESSSTVEDFMRSNNLSFTVLLDTTQGVAQSYAIQYIPTTFFIDKDGIIQDKLIGPFQSEKQIEDKLSEIMPSA